MIQAIRETNFTAYIETEAKRIDTSVDSSMIRHLCKFTNDLNKKVFYVYAALETIYDRYTKLEFDILSQKMWILHHHQRHKKLHVVHQENYP